MNVYVDLRICVIYRARHLMTDVRMLLPHSRTGTCIYTVKSNIVCIHLCRQVWESNFKHVGKIIIKSCGVNHLCPHNLKHLPMSMFTAAYSSVGFLFILSFIIWLCFENLFASSGFTWSNHLSGLRCVVKCDA